ncbi:MAG: DUF366 family protein [Deltaproteobacteria bacterium]|nr:DUF366 family protein [Deltaproteobacteria bacterium]
MKTYFHEQTIKYTGEQLSSHFAYKNFSLKGDSIVSFIGPCDVSLDHMVDLEDVAQKKHIYSENMLHFIVEHFHDHLTTVIAFQRLLIDLVRHEICESKEGLIIQRRGDDLFDDIYKLTVSIATRSPLSSLIHAGINISSKNTPVPTRGLEDYQINPHAVATGVLNRYRAEFEGIKQARCKVRGVC